MNFKYLLSTIVILILTSVIGCSSSNTDNPNNVEDNQSLKVELSKYVVENNASTNINISYSINSNQTLTLKIFMEDSVYYSGQNQEHTARCFVKQQDYSLNASQHSILISINPSTDFLVRSGECNCFPLGVAHKSYKIYAEIPNIYKKDSTIVVTVENRYKTDYYYMINSINYDVLSKTTNNSHWSLISDLFGTKLLTTLKYPNNVNHYNGTIVYNSTEIAKISDYGSLRTYLSMTGVPFTEQSGTNNKDKTILIGFANLTFGITTDPDVYGATVTRRSNTNNNDGTCALSVIVSPKLEAMLTSHGYTNQQKEFIRRALVAHELGHARGSGCYVHRQDSQASYEEKNCIMNYSLILENVLSLSSFTICPYHKLQIERWFWYPGNLNFKP